MRRFSDLRFRQIVCRHTDWIPTIRAHVHSNIYSQICNMSTSMCPASYRCIRRYRLSNTCNTGPYGGSLFQNICAQGSMVVDCWDSLCHRTSPVHEVIIDTSITQSKTKYLIQNIKWNNLLLHLTIHTHYPVRDTSLFIQMTPFHNGGRVERNSTWRTDSIRGCGKGQTSPIVLSIMLTERPKYEFFVFF